MITREKHGNTFVEQITCDIPGCGRSYDPSGDTYDDLRGLVSRQGWEYWDDRDYCPDHAHLAVVGKAREGAPLLALAETLNATDAQLLDISCGQPPVPDFLRRWLDMVHQVLGDTAAMLEHAAEDGMVETAKPAVWKIGQRVRATDGMIFGQTGIIDAVWVRSGDGILRVTPLSGNPEAISWQEDGDGRAHTSAPSDLEVVAS